MADEVTISNQALGYLGVDPISSLDDNIKSAILIKNVYAELRDSLTEEGDWRFAVERMILEESSDTPEFGEGKYFTVPDRVLRIVSVNSNRDDWDLEGGNVITSSGVVNAVTIVKVENVNRMTRMFRQALASRIAMELALPLTQSKSMFSGMVKMYEFKLDMALSHDGLQGTTRKFSKGRIVGARQNGQDLGGRSNVFGPTV